MFPVNIIHDKAEQLGLKYLVIGGHAFNTYGVPRATVDVDFLISRNERKGWTELLRENGFKLLQESSTVLVFAPADGIEWHLDMIVVNDDTFAKLYGAANEVEMLGVKTRVPSLEHFMALKLHTVKFGPRYERDQDLCDVLTLTGNAEKTFAPNHFRGWWNSSALRKSMNESSGQPQSDLDFELPIAPGFHSEPPRGSWKAGYELSLWGLDSIKDRPQVWDERGQRRCYEEFKM